MYQISNTISIRRIHHVLRNSPLYLLHACSCALHPQIGLAESRQCNCCSAKPAAVNARPGSPSACGRYGAADSARRKVEPGEQHRKGSALFRISAVLRKFPKFVLRFHIFLSLLLIPGVVEIQVAPKGPPESESSMTHALSPVKWINSISILLQVIRSGFPRPISRNGTCPPKHLIMNFHTWKRRLSNCVRWRRK